MTKRKCLRCRADLTDVMGCYVFVTEGGSSLRRVDGLLCVPHGSNGANVLTARQYEHLTR